MAGQKKTASKTPALNSFNHYAYGSIGSWMYSTIAGIQIDAEQPAYKLQYFAPAARWRTDAGGG